MVAWFCGIFGAASILLSVLMYLGLRLVLYHSLDRSLVAIATAEAASASDAGGELHLHDPWVADISRSAKGAAAHFAQILGQDGRVLLRSAALQPNWLPVRGAAVEEALAGHVVFHSDESLALGEMRVVYLPFRSSKRKLHLMQVGISTAAVRQTLNYLLAFVVVANAATITLMCLGGMALARKVLVAVDEVASTAAAISGRNLGKRLKHQPTNDEMGRLVIVFNKMLGRLEQAFASQQRFAANASHQIRSPLAAIRGEIDVALRDRRTPEDYRRVLHKVRKEAGLLTELVSNLLLLSRTEGSQLDDSQERFAIDELVVEVAAAFGNILVERRVELRLEVSREVMVRGNRELFAQVFRNLLDNAIRYSLATSLRLRVEEVGRHVQVTMEDNGVGISRGSLPLIFEPFYRGERAAELHPDGSGLGLAICRSIVRAHGGEIAITPGSGDGRGTAVVVELPREDSVDRPGQPQGRGSF